MRASALIPVLVVLAAACTAGPRQVPGASPDSSPGPDASGDDAGIEDAAIPGWPDVPSVPPPDILLGDLSSPCGVAVGADGIYVVEGGAGRVLVVPPEGGEPEERAVGLANPSLIALGPDAAFVTERETESITRIDDEVTWLVTDQVNLGRIRVRDGFVYFVDTGEDGVGAAIRRVPVEGGAAEDLATEIAPPRGLDVTATRCYFTASEPREVAYIPLDGGETVRIVDDVGTPIDVRVDEEAGEVYWLATGSGRWVHRMDLDLAGDARVSFSPGGPSWLALDETHAYWSTGQAILRAPREGVDAPYEDLVVQTRVCDLAVADGVVYWTDPHTGRLLRHVLP